MIVGTVVRAHGVGGALLVRPVSPALLAATEARVAGQARRVRCARAMGGGVLLEVEGVATRTAAEALRGADVAVPRAALPPLAEGERYAADLVGYTAVTLAGQRLGEVAGVADYGAGEILLLRDPERLVPLGGGALIEVRDAERAVVLALPEGLP